MNQPYPPQGQGPYGPPPPGQQPPPYYGQQPPPGPYSPGAEPPPVPGAQPFAPATPPGGQLPPPPYGQQPVQPYPPQPPAGKPKPSRKRRLITAGIALVVIAGIAIAALYFSRNEPSRANEGDCIKVNKATATDANVERIDCSTKEAAYKIGKKLDSSGGACPEGDYVEYTETGRNSLKLCLVLNAKEGDCFTESDRQDKRSDCAGADFKVAKVVTGKADPAECGEGAENALTYSQPATTICRVAAT